MAETGKVWVVIEQEMYEPGPVRVVGVFSSEESAERAYAENDSDRSIYEVTVDAAVSRETVTVPLDRHTR